MEPETSGQKKPAPNAYLKYSGLAIQLFLTIGIAGWLGYKLDQYLDFTFPVFLIVFIVFSFGGMMYYLFRELNKK